MEGTVTNQMKHKLQIQERVLGLNNPKVILVLFPGLNTPALDLREADVGSD